MNVVSKLKGLGIRLGEVQGCQDIGALVDSPERGRRIIAEVLGVDQRFSDLVYARVCAKAVFVEVVRVGYEVEDVAGVLMRAKEYTDKFVSDPRNSYLWSVDESVVEEVAVKQVVGGEVKIKHGSKQVLAAELYVEHVIGGGISNVEFVKLLIAELGMSRAGATTYAYNARKAYVG